MISRKASSPVNRPGRDRIGTISLLCLLGAATLIPVQTGQTATQRLETQLTLSSDQLRELDIDADEGDLLVTGSKSADTITVNATVTVKGDISDSDFNEFLNTWMDLDLYRHGRSAELIAKISAGSLITYQPRIDLEITMPAELDLVIKDGGGTLTVIDIESDIEIKDSSGKIVLQRIRGDVEIEDGAGSVEIADSFGDIELQDLTGWVRLTAVDGSMFINKTSGKIRIDGLTGDLVIEGDAELDIEAVNLGGRIQRPD